MRRRVAAVAMAAVVLACRERGHPNPDIRMAISHERLEAAAEPSQTPGVQNEVPTRLEIPPEVAQVWSGVRIGWKDKTNGTEGVIEVPLGGATPLPDPSFVVRADAFLPAFSMGGGAITSEGVEPQNPAARIAVFEKGKEVFAGWVFTRFPDVHPFTHPRYQLRLEGGVPKAPK
ncbi:MAG: DUF2155 domain-containing protein [Acidobacteriota bacterium]